MNAGTDTATPDTRHDSGEPAGNRYRLAEQAKQLAGSHATTLARLDAFEDTLRIPASAVPDPTARNPNRPIPVSGGPTPMPGFPETGREPEARPRRPSPPPDDRRVGAVAPLLALLLGVLLSWTGADLLRPMGDGAPLWEVVRYLPGVLLVLALLGVGAAVAAALATPRARPSTSGRPEGPAEQGPPVPRARLTASLLLYLAVLGGIVLWTVLWVAAAAPIAAPSGVPSALAGALLVGVVALAILPAQLRRARVAARAGRERGGAPWDGDGAPPDFPPPPPLDVAAWWRSLRHQRRERRRRRTRDRARSAVATHARAWEDVYHECQRHADTHDTDSAPARAALRELGSVRPATPETEVHPMPVEFTDMDLAGNMATIIRCLARYHPSALEARFERVGRAFRTETVAGVESTPR